MARVDCLLATPKALSDVKRQDHFESSRSTLQKLDKLIINQGTRLKAKTPNTLHSQLLPRAEAYFSHSASGTMSGWCNFQGKKSMEAAKVPVPDDKVGQGVERGYLNRRRSGGRRSILKDAEIV